MTRQRARPTTKADEPRKKRSTNGVVYRRNRKSRSRDWAEEAVKFQGDECLPWPFSAPGGYGEFQYKRVRVRVNRYVCEKVHGAPPTDRHEAAHLCGNSLCCNPRHLAWKTHIENIADKRIHGTLLMGERHHQAKLTQKQVLEIRSLHMKKPLRRIAEKYGVGRATVENIIYGVTWTHV